MYQLVDKDYDLTKYGFKKVSRNQWIEDKDQRKNQNVELLLYFDNGILQLYASNSNYNTIQRQCMYVESSDCYLEYYYADDVDEKLVFDDIFDFSFDIVIRMLQDNVIKKIN